MNNLLFSFNVGDKVDEIAFNDVDFSDEGNMITQRNLSDIIDSGKPVIIYFESISFS